MKRTVVLIRHAKSSWADTAQDDLKRPLNDRGEHDAPLMGEHLKKIKLKPDLIITSPAKRAKQTANKIAKELNYDKDKIAEEEKLYLCAPSTFEEVISDLKGEVETVFIVGHNPGITEFVNELSDDFKTDNMPTCAIAGVQVNIPEWKDFGAAKKDVFVYEYPKKFYEH